LRAGWEGVLVLPAVLLALALVWMVLWAPRVVLHEDSVEVRNVFVTHHIPFAAIQEVRLGAMLRFEVITQRAATSTITAWNAPALGREDRKSTRLNSSHVSISYAVFCLKKKIRR